MSGTARWRRCSTCKADIGLDTTYWTCSVSTCNRARGALQFCSVSCWDAHVPILRHRDAWAVEARSPRTPDPAPAAASTATRAAQRSAEPARPAAPAPAPPAAIVRKPGGSPVSPAPTDREEPEREILIVVSKLKRYIRERSGMNTSDACADPLSDWVRAVCDRAIANARDAERKTVLERDIPQPRF